MGAVLAIDLLRPQPQRHEGRVEGAFCKQSAEEIGDLQDRKERVGKDAGAEQRCDAHVAGKSEQPRRQRRSAHGGDIARERHETWPPHLL